MAIIRSQLGRLGYAPRNVGTIICNPGLLLISDPRPALSSDDVDGVELEVRRRVGHDSVGVGIGAAAVVESRGITSIFDDVEYRRCSGADARHRRFGARRSRRGTRTRQWSFGISQRRRSQIVGVLW